MIEPMTHESEFVRHFVIPAKRERYLSLLQSRKGRRKVLDRLNHPKDMDLRQAASLVASEQTVEHIAALLKKKGAPDHCYVISSNAEIDGLELPLQEALDRTIGRGMGTIISCIPGKLAYFEGEELNERYLFEQR